MLQNEENIAQQISQILYTFVLYMQKFASLSAQKWCQFLCVIQKYTKFVKFAGLSRPHFTTFRDQTLQFY